MPSHQDNTRAVSVTLCLITTSQGVSKTSRHGDLFTTSLLATSKRCVHRTSTRVSSCCIQRLEEDVVLPSAHHIRSIVFGGKLCPSLVFFETLPILRNGDQHTLLARRCPRLRPRNWLDLRCQRRTLQGERQLQKLTLCCVLSDSCHFDLASDSLLPFVRSESVCRISLI